MSARKPKVLISGAGVGGLTLAILLEKAGVSYEVYERMQKVKPIGSALSLGWNIAPFFKQIGIYDDFVSIAKPYKSMDTYNENREFVFSMPSQPLAEMGGSDGYMITRVALYDLLLRQVSADKIHMSKRVVRIDQDEHSVKVHFSDNTTAEGDILVGADGAHSTVRQSLYASLKEQNQLPLTDDGALPFSCIRLTGMTKPLDPAKYPELLDPRALIHNVVGTDKPYSWLAMTMRGNIYCWGITHHLDASSSKDHFGFQDTDWSPDTTGEMCKAVRDFPIPGGVNNDLTLGDMIDETLTVSKVMLEEKVFDTWYSGRTVLLGDACHKTHPAGAAGAVNAMHDAVALANWISVLDSTTIESVEHIFSEYKQERHPAAVASFNSGKVMNTISGTYLVPRISRFIIKNMPTWLYRMALKTMTANRPQVSFLPLVKDTGTIPPNYQPSLEKTLAIHKARVGVVTA
ncbi:hypothetical protein EDD11_009705 [Mortierella claussenii]|nr:hypothetical protein EDD11_009705 [Mortierella claussenii]